MFIVYAFYLTFLVYGLAVVKVTYIIYYIYFRYTDVLLLIIIEQFVKTLDHCVMCSSRLFDCIAPKINHQQNSSNCKNVL